MLTPQIYKIWRDLVTNTLLQIIGGVNQDRLTIAVARELETAFGGWVDPTEKYKVYKYEPIRGMPSSPRHHSNSTSSQSNSVTKDSPVDR